jgi:hypothetical protein
LIKPVKLNTIIRSRSRVASLTLLCLLAHAFFVSITHHHASLHKSAPAANVTMTAENDGGSGAKPDSTDDSHCLSCRLQRNFTSNIHTATVVVQPIEEPLYVEPFLVERCSRGSSLLIFGRAPPLS